MRHDHLPVVSPNDPRVGSAWVSIADIGASRGQTKASGEMLVKRVGLAPVAVVAGSGGRLLFSRGEATTTGLIPDPPFDPGSEVRLSALARERGVPPMTLLHSLACRANWDSGSDKGLGPNSEEWRALLARNGIARKLGKSWVVKRQMAEKLLRPAYDPAVEATLDDLLQEYGGFANTQSLAMSMRGAVPMRKILDLDGRHRLIAQRDRAQEWLAARQPRRTPLAPTCAASTPRWRSTVGPIILTTPSNLVWLEAATAEWILAGHETEPARTAVGESRSIEEVEGELLRRGDYLGLLLLARFLDGRLAGPVGSNRVAALVAVPEKTE
jgi:hypothetical protein